MAVNAHRDDAERVENADVKSAMTIFCAPMFEPNESPRRQHRRKIRTPVQKKNFLHTCGSEVFLEHDFIVREGLKNPGRPKMFRPARIS